MATVPKGRQDADRLNHNDRDSLTDPNAMGPSMRSPYDATASGPEAGADMHNDHYPAPYPRIQRGNIGVHGKRSTDDKRSGPGGRFDSYVK